MCVIWCPQFSSSQYSHVSIKLFLVWLSLDSLHSAVTHSFDFDCCEKSLSNFPYLNTGWKTAFVFVLCRPGYTFIAVTGTGKEVIVRIQASTVLFSGHRWALIIIWPDGMWLHKVWVPSQGGVIRDLFSCLNKEPIHAPVDLICLLIHSLRWTLLFAGTTCVWSWAGGHLPYQH